jgi:hypothetical protein
MFQFRFAYRHADVRCYFWCLTFFIGGVSISPAATSCAKDKILPRLDLSDSPVSDPHRSTSIEKERSQRRPWTRSCPSFFLPSHDPNAHQKLPLWSQTEKDVHHKNAKLGIHAYADHEIRIDPYRRVFYCGQYCRCEVSVLHSSCAASVAVSAGLEVAGVAGLTEPLPSSPGKNKGSF